MALFDDEKTLHKLVSTYVASTSTPILQDETEIKSSVAPSGPKTTTASSSKDTAKIEATTVALKESKPRLSPLKTIQHKSKIVTSVGKTIPACHSLDISQPISIRFLDCINPQRFWFAEIGDYKLLNSLMRKMQKFYNKNMQLKVKRSHLQKGLYVAVEVDGLWHRSLVVEIFEGLVRVFFVDFGSVVDFPINEVRYLIEEFTETPCIAQRGTLSHVQPKEGSWSVECIRFFKQTLPAKPIDSKIFRYNQYDSSYQMAIKVSIEDGSEKVLLTRALINNDWCIYDPEDKQIVNATELNFMEYEAGKHLQKPEEDSWLPLIKEKPENEIVETEDSWLPVIKNQYQSKKEEVKEKSIENVTTKISSSSAEALNSSSSSFLRQRRLRIEIPKQTSPDIVQRKIVEQSVSPPTVGSIQTIPNTIVSEVVQRKIVEQSLSKLPVGSIQTIHFYVIHDMNDFFFYRSQEYGEIKDYLNKFK